MSELKKEFVPYTESLELKELGFDEPCLGEYRQWDGNEPWLQLYQDLDGCSTDPADYEYTVEAKAPTFSQAFRWFREKYGLNSEIHYAGKKGEYHVFVKNYMYGNNGNYPSIFAYEQAELECLRKLIEIVKTNKI